MNLFWATRRLTAAREDHLTAFLAAALETDSAFRAAYARTVLKRGSTGDDSPIVSVETEVRFADQRCRPDLMLVLEDGRRVLCEHKLDAPETLQAATNGESAGQLERYLALPDISGVAYFRSARGKVPGRVISHERYIRPEGGDHFLWRDLYPALSQGESDAAQWLREGFERLGFVPPVPHVGELWPDDTEEVKANQRNFGKLWDSTRAQLTARYEIQHGRRCELYLTPREERIVRRIYMSPLADSGSRLRMRMEVGRGEIAELRERFERNEHRLPVSPDYFFGQLPSGAWYLDLLVSLHQVLADSDDSATQERRLATQVVPAVAIAESDPSE